MSSISQLNYAAYIIGSYLPLICFILGIIGLSLNCILLTQRAFRNHFSNVNIRSWSSIKIAKRSICIITITMIIIYAHMLLFYQLFYTTNSNGTVSVICNPPTGFYAIFTSLLHTAIYSCLPTILMFIFGTLTLININRQRRIIVPVNMNGRGFQQPSRLNNQLVKMLIIQILVISITTFPLSVQRVYAAFTTDINKNSYRIAQENLFSQIAQGFSYLAHTTNFYFFTLSGFIFRKELKRLFIRFINYFHGINNNNNNRLMPDQSINTVLHRTQMQKHQSQPQQLTIT